MALFAPAQAAPLTLSFSNLVESFILASMCGIHGVSMQWVRKALTFVGQDLGVPRPLNHTRFRTDGVRLFVDQADRLLDVSSPEQEHMREVLNASLERVDWGHDVAECFYPWVRGDMDGPKGNADQLGP